MPIERLRLATFCVYLATWLVLAIAAAAGAMAGRHRRAAAFVQITAPVIVGTLLQAAGAFAITLSLGKGPLRPTELELIGALLLAPLAAGLFCWALRSVPYDAGAGSLVTTGAYAWMRHPIYLAFFAMLLATGLLTSTGPKLAVAAALYLAGSELRIATEEAELVEKFPAGYAQYRSRTRWRYLPGLR